MLLELLVLSDPRPKEGTGVKPRIEISRYSVGLTGNIGEETVTEDSDIVAPLPTLGASFDYAISDKWLFTSMVGIFGLEVDLSDEAKFSGKIVQLNAGFGYKAFKSVGFALQYNYFRVDVNINDLDWIGELKYEYQGPVLSIAAYL